MEIPERKIRFAVETYSSVISSINAMKSVLDGIIPEIDCLNLQKEITVLKAEIEMLSKSSTVYSNMIQNLPLNNLEITA